MDALPTVVPAIAPQPPGVEWPTTAWPAGRASPAVRLLVDQAFEDDELTETYAVVVIQGGRLVAERYGGALPSFTAAPKPVTPATPLLSWSMAKSMLHAAVGLLVADGALSLDVPAGIREWQGDDDPRRASGGAGAA